MELYLDSADINEIEAAFELGYLAGLTTTPTFMHREGVKDIDALILKLAGMVPVLQVEALGNSVDEIVSEAHRLLALGLDKSKTVFKIPISLIGTQACYRLRQEGIMVNIHLVYTLQQAYMAMSAGANYVCPLVGRLQDQGHDALGLVDQCIQAVKTYGYDTKIMFSSVRNPEHVRNAFNLGVHTVTVPWKVMKSLTQNHFTDIGTRQFEEHTRLMTVTVGEVIRANNPVVSVNKTVVEASVEMSYHGFGAVTVVNEHHEIVGIFTDGDLRRLVGKNGKDGLQQKLSSLSFNTPLQIEASAPLYEANELFREKKVDTLIVTDNRAPIGMIDVQDMLQ